MTELYEIQDIETLPGMDADLSEKMMPEEAFLRFVSGKSKEIRFDIDVPDNATADEIRKLAKEYFYHHYKVLMDLSSVEIKLHPEGVLTHDTVFVGQIVRCVDLGRIGIVIRHKKGVKRRIPVLFSNGEVRSFEPHSLCPTTTAYHKMHFTPSPYTPSAPLEEGVIYDVTGTDEIPGMAVVTFSKTHKKKNFVSE
jgi:hypothetical protein